MSDEDDSIESGVLNDQEEYDRSLLRSSEEEDPSMEEDGGEPPAPPTFQAMLNLSKQSVTLLRANNTRDAFAANEIETDDEGSPVSSLSEADSPRKKSTHSKRIPATFRLGAPQIMDDEESDMDLEEGQQPSQSFLKDWEDPDEQQPSRQSLTKSPLSPKGKLVIPGSSRGNSSRRSRGVSQGWGELAHSASVGNLQDFDDQGVTSKMANPSSRFGPSAMLDDFHTNLDDSGPINYDQFNDSGPIGAPPSPKPAGASKILQRMKQGIMMNQDQQNLTEYYASTLTRDSRRANMTPEERALQKERRQYRSLYIICFLITILTIVAVSMVIGLVADEVQANNAVRDIPDPTEAPTLMPTTQEPTDMPSASPSTSEPTISPTAFPTLENPLDTLDTILARGRLRCGILEVPGLANRITNTATGNLEYEGMDVDWCRAIAAALFGDASALELVVVTQSTRFAILNGGVVDLLAAGSTVTLERSVYERDTGVGFQFSTPYLYDGVGLAGEPSAVECAEAQDFTSIACRDLRICVVQSTTHRTVVEGLIPGVPIVSRTSFVDQYRGFGDGLCNVMAGEQSQLVESIVREESGYTGDYVLGQGTYSKEPLALVTRNSDPRWSDFVNWILTGIIYAEQQNIDDKTAISMGSTDLFGPDVTSAFINAVGAVGNYGQIYSRHLQSIVPRREVNQVNINGETGLFYSLPFGDLSTVGENVRGTLQDIIRRGFLRCGISRRTFFAEFNTQLQQWEGLDIDFCRAVSAAIFDGVFSTVEYVDVDAKEMFSFLGRGDIDLIARSVTITLERDVQESSTGQGFSFSPPVFYDKLSFGGVPSFTQCANDINTRGDPCQDLSICFVEGTIFEEQSATLFPERFFVPAQSNEGAVLGLRSGVCNVIVGGKVDVSTSSIQENGFTGDYATDQTVDLLPQLPMGMVTRDDDAQWSAFVFWVVNALIYAEEEGITQATSTQMPVIDLFGIRFIRIFRNAVGSVGSLGEIYQRNLQGTSVTRQGLSQLNVSPFGPQLYPYPGFK